MREADVGQLPPECPPPDMPWPVEPKPPRAVEPEPELRDVLLLMPVRLPDSAVETEVGAELRENQPPE
jgi:hypothetical protein